MEQKLPHLLNYNQLKPIGYPSQIKYYKFTPQAFASSGTNEIVRFNIDSTGFWDPYSAYIELEVDCSDMDPNSTLQIDNSAQSFINELIINSQGTEIERIQEYDVLASILYDMNMSNEQRQSKRHEGVGHCNVSNLKSDVFATSKVGQYAIGFNEAGTYVANACISTYGFKPWILEHYRCGVAADSQLDASSIIATYGKVIDLNKRPDGATSSDSVQNAVIQGLRHNLVRYDTNHARIDNSTTIEKYNVINNINKKAAITNYSAYDTEADDYMDVKDVGYSQPFNPSLSYSCFEPTFSRLFKQSTTFKGQLNQAVGIVKQRFQIPIISGLLGVLMPMESYKYIPMGLLKDLTLELRLNPHAMFTSGYTDTPTITAATSSLAGTGLAETLTLPLTGAVQARRRWKISDIAINVELHYFEPNVERIILDSINSENGVVLHSQSWLLGPIYPIAANQGVGGNFPINLGFESMKTVVIAFLANDYQRYSFCRKSFRLSHNITEMQFKIGQEYYPSEKIRGCGGIPVGIGEGDSTLYGNNSQFVIELFKCFGKFHNVAQDCGVNAVNFAVNERAYDPTSTLAMFKQTGTLTTAGPKNNEYIFELQNIDTANGMPLFHENRCVGKALYALNFETMNTDFSVISGINTMQSKPFDVILRSDGASFTDFKSENVSTVRFQRDSQMYVFCNYDMIVQLKKNGIHVLGRG